MTEICRKCGLPRDICACQTMEREETTKIRVSVENKKFGKVVTIVEGIDPKDIDRLTKELKHKLACGGTGKDGVIVLQGNHGLKIKQVLISLGYLPENIVLEGE